MIDIRKAYEKAKKEAQEHDLANVKDTGEMWIFIFEKKDKTGRIIPQTPNITVNKEDGTLGRLPVPPIENLMIIRSAKEVDFKA